MRLLVAEDHPSLARSLADGLREEGYAVDLTFDGQEAGHLATGQPVRRRSILDIMLPKVDGWSLLKLIRRHKPTLPVLCLTARDAVEDRVKGLDLGADDYLVKPFSWEELLARVRALVRRGHGQGSPALRVADLEIDLAPKDGARGPATRSASAPASSPCWSTSPTARGRWSAGRTSGSTCTTSTTRRSATS